MNRLALQLQRISAQKPEQVHIPISQFHEQQPIGYTSGIRPYRVAGVRMEKQIINGKIIYHNYGHGGGGISVGYGCSDHVITNYFLPEKAPKHQRVAVLGAGIIGLTTAYILTLKGFSVNIYYDIFPFEESTGKPEITSTVAAGYWMPLKMGEKQKMITIATKDFNHFKGLEEKQGHTGEQLGVTTLMAYCINDDQGLTYMKIPEIIDPQPVVTDLGDGQLLKGVKFPTFVIELHKYLPYLIREIKKTGLATFQKSQLNKKSIFGLKQKHIFNCLGFNGGKFFGDSSEMRPIKGTVCMLQLQPHRAVKDFVLFLKTPEGRWILQVPHIQQNSLKLGINYDEGNGDLRPDRQQAMRIFHTAKKYFASIIQKKGSQ